MEKLKVLYDGHCHVCYSEIQHYLKKDKQHLLEAIDIAGAGFKASDFKLTEEAVNLELHAIDESGIIYTGISTFIEIWKRVPAYKKIIPVFENRFLRPGFDFGYIIFARYIRPYLPKRKCGHGYCELD